MTRLQPRDPELQTVARNLVILLPLLLTMALNPPPASQVGPRREAAAGVVRDHQQITRYRFFKNNKMVFCLDSPCLGVLGQTNQVCSWVNALWLLLV